MITFNLAEKLFSHKKEKILISGSAEKHTHEAGPMGIGFSKARGSLKPPAKFNGVATFLDEVLVRKSVNALCSDSLVYGEYNDGSKTYRFTCEGTKISYEGERIHGFGAIIPVALYHLRNDALLDEFVDVFKDIVATYNKTSLAESKDILLFCDAFYYGVAKKSPDIEVVENELQIETVQAAIRSGLLNKMNSLNDVSAPALTGVSIQKRKKATENKSKNKSELFDKIRSGDFILNYEWSEEQKTRVAPLSFLDEFVPSDMYYDSLKQITHELNQVTLRMDGGLTGADAIGQNCVNFFLIGKPGTGKTTMAKAISAATGMPLYSVPIQKNSEEDTFQGMTKASDGVLKFVNTDFLNAFKNGGIILLEEINLADPAVIMGAIGQATEDPYYILEDGYKMVKRHPLCVIIGAFNVGTAGSKEINDALSSRFSPTYQVGDPSKDDFIKTLMKADCDKKTAGWVYNAYTSIINYLKSPSINAEDIAMNVTFRACRGIVKSLKWGTDPKKAVYYNIIGKIAEKELQLAEDVYKNVVIPLPELI